MSLVLLDTDVFSMFHRRDYRRLRYRADVEGKVRCLCFASVAELRFGALIANWGHERRRILEQAMVEAVVLPPDDAVTQIWAKVKAAHQQIGQPIASEAVGSPLPRFDTNIPLLTHNAKDYRDIDGLKMISHVAS